MDSISEHQLLPHENADLPETPALQEVESIASNIVSPATNCASLVSYDISSSEDEEETPAIVIKEEPIECDEVVLDDPQHFQEGTAQESMDQQAEEGHVSIINGRTSPEDEHIDTINNEQLRDDKAQVLPLNGTAMEYSQINTDIIVNIAPPTESLGEGVFLTGYRQQTPMHLTSDEEENSAASSDSSDSEDGSALGYESSSSESSLYWSSDEAPEKPKILPIPKKKDLIPYDEGLPPIEDLHISVEESEAEPIGKVSHFVEHQVIVQAYPNIPPIDLDSVLFLDCGKRALGAVHDVFGPIQEPLYVVRFNSVEHIKEKKVEKGMLVFFAPQTDHTSFVILNDLLSTKGSDASWKDNTEPPEKHLDYSDDEEERRAKQARKQAKKPVTTGSSSEFESRFKKVRHEDSNPFSRSDVDCFIVNELKKTAVRQERKRPPPRGSGRFREPPRCPPGPRFGGPPLLRSPMPPLSPAEFNEVFRSTPPPLLPHPPPPLSPFMGSSSTYNSFQSPFSPRGQSSLQPPPLNPPSPSMRVPPPPPPSDALSHSNLNSGPTPHTFNSSPHSQGNPLVPPHPSVGAASHSSTTMNPPPPFAPSVHAAPPPRLGQPAQHVPPPLLQQTVQSLSHCVGPPPPPPLPPPPPPQPISAPPQHMGHPPPLQQVVTQPSHVGPPFAQNAVEPSMQHSGPPLPQQGMQPPPQHSMQPPHNAVPSPTQHVILQHTVPPPPQHGMPPPQQHYVMLPPSPQQTAPPPILNGGQLHLVPPPPPPPPPHQPSTNLAQQHVVQPLQHAPPPPPTFQAGPQHNSFPTLTFK